MITEIENYNIRHHNTFRMDVNAARWIEYTEATDLPEIFRLLGDDRFFCIGEGSNLLFLKDFDGALLHSRILDFEMGHDAEGNLQLRIGSGIRLDDVIAQLAAAGIWGLENLSYIPGYAGSAAVQNVGAYGVEIKDFISTVDCYDRETGTFVTFSRDDCGFGYRRSIFKHPENKKRYVVTHINLLLPLGAGPKLEYGGLGKSFEGAQSITPNDVRDAIIEMRRSKLPDVEETGSAGSFFINPVVSEEDFNRIAAAEEAPVPHFMVEGGVKIPAAWFIDRCGLKGYRHKSAAVWAKQPLVIVNADGKASPADIVELEEKIINEVKHRFGVTLHPEVDHI